MTTAVIFLMIVFLLLGTPLYVFLFGISVYLFWQADIPLLSTVVSFKKLQFQEFVYAIPLFTFAGYLLSRSQSPQRIIKLVQTCLYFFPASSSIITVAIMALFTALTGASGVTILALGGLLFPLLKKTGGNEVFAHGLITASGSIGLLLAPSLPVIIYTVIANQNNSSDQAIDLNTLFNNALIPSLIIFASFIGYSFFKERRQKEIRYNWTQVKKAIFDAKWEIPLPFLVYGGIYSGFFTVLEVAVLVVVYAFFVVFIVCRDLVLKKDFIAVTIDSLKLSGGIFIIMATAFVLTNYMVYERIPDQIFAWISPYLTNRFVFLLAINILLLITGCFLDIFSAILVVLPLILPIVERYQIDPYHFALIFLVNLELGYLTPPVGLNLFISSYSFKKPITYLYRSIIPFLIILFIILMIITYIPFFSTRFSSNISQPHSQEEITPPMIQSITASSIQNDNAELTIKINQVATSEMGVRIYYLDEEEAEKDMVIDFGEYLDIPFGDKNWVMLGGTKANIRLTNLEIGTTYTVIVEPYINKNDAIVTGLPSVPISLIIP